jgi:hypothetical protein
MDLIRTLRLAACTLFVGAVAASSSDASAQTCDSANPGDWPQSAKPYFMLVVDTSGSMNCCTTPAVAGCAQGNPVSFCNSSSPGYALNSCGMVPSRLNDAKCALRKTVQAFGGQVNLGMATYASVLSGCGNGACRSGNFAESDCNGDLTAGTTCNPENYGCSVANYPSFDTDGCGNFPACSTANIQLPNPPNFAEGTWRNGANVVVPLQQDPLSWTTPGSPTASNVPQLLQWFDESCANDRELFADGATPIAGSLRGVAQYLRSGWDIWTTGDYCTNNAFTHGTPMNALDRPCRNLNVLLVTDGDESCDTNADAVAAAQDLFQNGVTVGGNNYKVRVHVINFAGGNSTNTNAIAAAGGTTASVLATNETTLAVALSNIIGGAIAPETCDNADNNCNGCVDEGYRTYCNVGNTCCAWTTTPQRNTCLDQYKATISTADPDGDLTKLPCTTAVQATNSSSWLCYDPGDTCDNVDNNCQGGADEGSLKCGSPLACPTTESCNGKDDDCDGTTDEGVCNGCVASPEVCDGCDNDCDGRIDEELSPVACGLANPAFCAGQRQCIEQTGTAGQCKPVQLSACNNAPTGEVCDGVDNDCDGLPDDGVAATACVPNGTPGGLIYGGTSQCRQGQQACGSTACVGFVGPSAEVCDGVDNDCDGMVDEGVPGVGLACGVNFAPCTPGLTACVNGALICQGGTPPQPEVCDGADNDCDGLSDEAPLADGPMPGMTGCWNVPGNDCSFEGLEWDAPPGGTCNGLGTLKAPCAAGVLSCKGAQGWQCVGGKLPANEVCDGADNDCDMAVDEDNFPQEGMACGVDTGECMPGVIDCQNGTLDCVGDVGPQAELCNGLDDNCDGMVDNGIPIGQECIPEYDEQQFPGERTGAPCRPGNLVCDGNGGFVCQGGVGPAAEVCDGVDNDCDGDIDETGPAPDGLDGTVNPVHRNLSCILDCFGS